MNKIRKYFHQLFCPHEKFVIDKQIRVIECCKCGKRSWLKAEPKDLFAPNYNTNKK